MLVALRVDRQAKLHMECTTAQALFAGYSRLTTEYFEAADTLANMGGKGDPNGFAAVKRRTEEIGEQCRAAKLALETHRAQHKCGSASREESV